MRVSRILVVEDEPAIALALEEDLKLEGYEVEVVAHGEHAARRAREQPFDLILLDVMLPGKDGFDVCRDLRRAGLTTPIILLTARTHDAEKVLGFELGADDYVTKPYSPRELRARIKARLRRPENAGPFRFGDMEVDFKRCELRRGGVPVDLTPTEFKLLTTFVQSPGRALSREYLLDKVWGHDAFITDRVVDNQVTNLRKKIEPDPSQPRHLQSVRGIGYRFDA
jgi:DNA-binding response OmpR family regulator